MGLTGLMALVKTVSNRPQYFAERLNTAMEGCGTEDRVLINIIVGRCEIDLANIKYEYERLYGKTLLSTITDVNEGECSGDYRNALAVLIGGLELNSEDNDSKAAVDGVPAFTFSVLFALFVCNLLLSFFTRAEKAFE